MALFQVGDTFPASPITLTRRELVQVRSGGPVLMALEAPQSTNDGAIIRDEGILILEAGQTLHIRATEGAAEIYRGPVV